MGIASFKDSHMNEAITIKVASIKLTEQVHIKGNPNYVCQNKPQQECCVIVRRKHDGYALITGWGDYQECILHGYEYVRAIVVNRTKGFLRRYGTDYISIDDIIIPDYMAKTTPTEWKMQRVIDRLGDKQKLDKPITLDHDHYLVDGYTRYLVAKQFGMKYVPVNWTMS